MFSVFISVVHFRDLRAKLEVHIDNVIRLQKEAAEQGVPEDSDYTSDSEDVSVFPLLSPCWIFYLYLSCR